MLPFGLVLFCNTLPALARIFLVGRVQRDSCLYYSGTWLMFFRWFTLRL